MLLCVVAMSNTNLLVSCFVQNAIFLFIYLSNDLLIDSDAATAVSSVEYDILRLVGYGKMGHIYIYIYIYIYLGCTRAI
jgi:hypothetical protein